MAYATITVIVLVVGHALSGPSRAPCGPFLAEIASERRSATNDADAAAAWRL
jgi:hypothetical protein